MSDVRIRSRIRERRQITLPRSVCEALGLDVGDSVELEVAEGALKITPARRRALDAIEAIRSTFAESGVTEDELLEAARVVREERWRARNASAADGS